MRIFLDTADLDAIARFARKGFRSGVTTNPAIIANGLVDPTPKRVLKHIEEISKLVDCVSVQLSGPHDRPERYLDLGKDIYVKVPLCDWGLDVADKLGRWDRINITAICTEQQAVLAAALRPKILSVFWNRALDVHGIPRDIVDVAKEACSPTTSVLVGSIRSPKDVLAAVKAGADIVTIAPKFITEAMQSEATDRILREWYPVQ